MEEIIILHKIDLSEESIEQILRSQCFTIVCMVKSMNPYIGQRVSKAFEEEWEDFYKVVNNDNVSEGDAISKSLTLNYSYAENLEMLHTSLCLIVQNEIDEGGLLR
jgi:hypothetical protein